MRRWGGVAVSAVALAAVFLFLVPVMQVGFVVHSPRPKCLPSQYGEILMGCGYMALPGKASVTYFLFGVGATYGSANITGYGLGYASCFWFSFQSLNVTNPPPAQRLCTSRLSV